MFALLPPNGQSLGLSIMTYSLGLFFKPAVELKRINRYFEGRRYFSLADRDAMYENPDTKVGFSFKFRFGRDLLLRQTAVFAEFEIRYGRPSWVADEAEIELSAFMAAFRPRIEDPQIHGMEEGPYSGAGFLRGWDFGNALAVRQIFVDKPDFRMATLPSERLRAIWAWNYGRAARQEASDRRFTPLIQFMAIDRRLRTVTVWPRGMPVWLPKVDYVLVGRYVGTEKRFGLAPWSEVMDVVAQNPRFDIANDPLDLDYLYTPVPIAKWVETIELIDLPSLERLPPRQVFDAELAVAARESIAAGEVNGAIRIEPPPRVSVAV